MHEKMLRALVAAGAVTRVNIVAHGSRFHVEARTPTGCVTAATLKGKVKTWATLDGAARWVRGLGVGGAQLQLAQWAPAQKHLI